MRFNVNFYGSGPGVNVFGHVSNGGHGYYHQPAHNYYSHGYGGYRGYGGFYERPYHQPYYSGGFVGGYINYHSGSSHPHRSEPEIDPQEYRKLAEALNNAAKHQNQDASLGWFSHLPRITGSFKERQDTLDSINEALHATGQRKDLMEKFVEAWKSAADLPAGRKRNEAIMDAMDDLTDSIEGKPQQNQRPTQPQQQPHSTELKDAFTELSESSVGLAFINSNGPDAYSVFMRRIGSRTVEFSQYPDIKDSSKTFYVTVPEDQAKNAESIIKSLADTAEAGRKSPNAAEARQVLFDKVTQDVTDGKLIKTHTPPDAIRSQRGPNGETTILPDRLSEAEGRLHDTQINDIDAIKGLAFGLHEAPGAGVKNISIEKTQAIDALATNNALDKTASGKIHEVFMKFLEDRKANNPEAANVFADATIQVLKDDRLAHRSPATLPNANLAGLPSNPGVSER